MNQLLFDRSTGNVRPRSFARIQTSQLSQAILPAPRLRFNGGEKEIQMEDDEVDGESPIAETPKIWAHQSGVNALALDIESRVLVSGGADSSIKLWDLQNNAGMFKHTFKPVGSIAKTASTHKFGITQLSFYPFDSAAFLSSSYDHHLKFYATETLSVSADFDLNSIIYTHALSPIADHLLVACATQHPAVRLVDLRSGASTHSLAGHHGALLALAWSPVQEHILASGCIDGTVRLWDIRKSSSNLGVLDLEDSTGIAGTDGLGRSTRARESGRAHTAAVNGLSFSDDGSYLVSAGHDDRIRVWDVSTAANTLASFGPTLKNAHLSNLPLLITPTTLVAPRQEVLFFPNERELLMFQMHEGRLLRRLRVPGPNMAAVRSRIGERNIKSRITGLVWSGQADGVYSAHTDGQIRAWLPQTVKDEILGRQEDDHRGKDHDEDEDASKKRKVLDDVFRNLTRQKVSFG